MSKYKISLSFFSFFLLIKTILFAQVTHIEPTAWFVDMPADTVQILVYGKNIKEYQVKSSHDKYVVKNVYTFSNNDYLIVSLSIPVNQPPADFELLFSSKKKMQKIPFSVKQKPNRKRGIDQTDVLYLIMPDRFANGDSQNDKIKGMHEQSLNRDSIFHRHGGDLKGIQQNLGYLKELGITALWLNPVVENNQPKASYHGYAVTNHYKIDQRLGTLNQYKSLIDNMHQQGIKMIMDVVHNHVGDKHPWFTNLPDSSWFNWHPKFTKTTYRETVLFDPYASASDRNKFSNGWFDHHMPDLNQNNPFVAQYLIQNHLWWVAECDIDAVRIDTYAYPDQIFMANWGKAMQRAFPDLSLFAETWVHGPAIQAWFTHQNQLNKNFENHMPAVTDFQLHYAINDAFTKQPGWTDGIFRLYYTLAQDFLYKDPTKHIIFLDNHDVSRFRSIVGENDKKMKAGLMFLFSLRGIPCLYYGTEIGMKNFADPDGKVRLDFPGGWDGDSVNYFVNVERKGDAQKYFDFTQQLIKLRKQYASIAIGELTQFIPNDGLYVYARKLGKQTFVSVVNASDKTAIFDWANYSELTHGFDNALDIINNQRTNTTKNITLQPYDCFWFILE